MPEREYIVYKVSKPAPVPKLKHLLVLYSIEYGIYAVHKCKEMLAFKQYI